ncbi:MAG: beta-mannosidase [Oscillospiraceae bacterium]|jgi:mannan endo-1,4-beta-mannosidase|nr:beta-mannosidase [Oscillospiraceae bacterium]
MKYHLMRGIAPVLAIVLLTLCGCGAPVKSSAIPKISDIPSRTPEAAASPTVPAARERLPRPPFEAPVPTRAEPLAPGQSGQDPVTIQAADAALYGSLRLSGDGGAGMFEQKDPLDMLEFTVNLTYEGFYRLDFEAKSSGGYKENTVRIDGEPAGTLVTDSAEYEPSALQNIYLTKGEHTIALTAVWGWISVKSLTLTPQGTPDGNVYNVPAGLVNPNADDNALALMSYLAVNYGRVSLAGQQSQGDWQSDHGLFGGEAEHIYELTGKRPAVIGLDMIDYTPSRVANGARSTEVEAAIEAWENNAIVTFCWHWNAPEQYITGDWWSAFYTEHTEPGFFKEIMDGDDPEGYDALIRDIDAIAAELTILRDAGVPVLWRPLHEASGGWFWWGTDRESYLELYALLYDRLTNLHNLTNLIWVWNGQHKNWYPGDNMADIIGEDVYAEQRSYASQVNRFLTALSYTDAPKMITLSENGVLFDPDLASRDGSLWSWWCVWNGDFVSGESYTENEMLRKVYNSELVVTHDELPDLKTHPIYIDE